MKKDTKIRVLDAARAQFAARGFAGARIEAIARAAGVNKAMLFYYFSSKKNLYDAVLHQTLGLLFERLKAVFSPAMTPEMLLEEMPRIYISFFAQHPDLVRIIGFDLLHNPGDVTAVLSDVVASHGIHVPNPPLQPMFENWHARGLINEADPKMIMLNIVGLCLISFLGLPIIETMFGEKVTADESFFERRIRSVSGLLKKGMIS